MPDEVVERLGKLEVRVEYLSKTIEDLGNRLSKLENHQSEISGSIVRIEQLLNQFETADVRRTSFRQALTTGLIVAFLTGIIQLILRLLPL